MKHMKQTLLLAKGGGVDIQKEGIAKFDSTSLIG
jgi:hypothetical protein